MKKGSREQWEQLGALTKEVYSKLLDITILASKIMPQSDYKWADRASNQMSMFKDRAEEAMYKQLGGVGDELLKIFYGLDTQEVKTGFGVSEGLVMSIRQWVNTLLKTCSLVNDLEKVDGLINEEFRIFGKQLDGIAGFYLKKVLEEYFAKTSADLPILIEISIRKCPSNFAGEMNKIVNEEWK